MVSNYGEQENLSIKNKNELLRESKIKGIKNAIQYLHEQGIISINKNLVAQTTKILYPNQREFQIDKNTLSNKEFYVNHFEKWVAEITGSGINHLEKAREAAVNKKRSNLEQKLVVIEKFGREFIKHVLDNKIVCRKFTVSFFVQWLRTNKNLQISVSSFSNEPYKSLFEKIKIELNRQLHRNLETEENNQDLRTISYQEYLHLKEEYNDIKTRFDRITQGLFVSPDGINLHEMSVYNEREIYKDILLDGTLVWKLVGASEREYRGKKLRADRLFEFLVSKCQTK